MFTDPLQYFSQIESERIANVMEQRYQEEKQDHYFTNHKGRMLHTLAMLPKAENNMSALELGACHQVLMTTLKQDFGYSKVDGHDFTPNSEPFQKQIEVCGRQFDWYNFDLTRHPFPMAEEVYDLVICCEILEHLPHDPMFMMEGINRVLKLGGILLLTTPNINSARSIKAMLNHEMPYLQYHYTSWASTEHHSLEYNPKLLQSLLEAAGMEIVTLKTRDSWSESPSEILNLLTRLRLSRELREDNIFVLSKKKGPLLDRYPKPLYK